MFDSLWNRIVLEHKKVKYPKNLRIFGRIYIHGKKNGIRIGDNCLIYSSESGNPTSGFNHTHITAWGDNGIKIGNNVGISNANIVSLSAITIEDNVLVGSGVKIWDLDFHEVDYEKRMEDSNSKGGTAPIYIKEGAFIGACAIILKGVTVGRHSVIGAGSVVTKDVPDGEIWVGNPARCIRKERK